MPKKRIVHYIANLKDGGAQTQLILLCNNINVELFEVFIVCWNSESSIPVKEHVNIVHVVRGSKYGLFSFFIKVMRITKSLQPDIIHLWLPEIITLPAALWGWRKRKIKVISTERRIPVTNFSLLWFRDRIKYINHLLSDVLIANFPLPIQQRSTLNYFARKKGKTIYNGIDFEVDSKKERGVHNDDFKLIYTGRFVAQKNVDIIIKTIKLLNDEGLNVSLSLFGDGYLRSDLERLTRDLALDSKVKFYGYIDDWKVLALTGDVFVLPTDREGMPNVLFEAAAIGLPLIVSSIEEVTCHFTNNYDALVIEKNEVSYLQQAVKKLYFNSELKKLLVHNNTKTIKNYTIDKMVSAYQDLYNEFIIKSKL